MNNELIKVEEKQLIIKQNVIDKIKELESKKKIIEEKEKEFREKLAEIMEENDITDYESNDKTLKIHYTPSTTTQTFDTKRFQEERFSMYLDYLKETKRKGSLRITVRSEEDVE